MFLGYSLSQSAFLCLEPSTSRIFVSRHVQFIETELPFKALSLPQTQLESVTQMWCPPVTSIPVSSPQPPSLVLSPGPPQPPGLTSLPSETNMLDLPSSSRNSTSVTVKGSVVDLPPSVTEPPVVAAGTQPAPALPENSHPMQTRSKSGITKQLQKKSTAVPLSDDEPANVTQAMKYHRWRGSMSSEFDTQISNHTWDLVSPSPNYNLIGNKWIFRVKRKPDGSIERFKS